MPFATRPLSPAGGVEVLLDPFTDLDDHARRAEFRHLFLEHHLLLVRGHRMTVADTVRVCGAVATVLQVADAPPEAYVSSPNGNATLPNVEIPWHSDMNFLAMPHLGASLYAEEIDEFSSPTWFANACRAAAHLSPELRTELEGIEAVHVLPAVPGYEPVDPGQPDVCHPVLWNHPITGEPLLYLSERQTWQPEVLVGVDPAVGDRLVNEVLHRLYADDNVYRHEWQTDDLVIWDNLAVQHRRDSVIGRRTLRRLALVEGAGDGDPYFAIQAAIRVQQNL
jgi:taurine dioxygenase